ncbi:MAG: SDR family oxidoreductase, partial [Bacilli bacterium]
MANTYFFTGFPGFIASSLIKQLLYKGYEIDHIYLLVLPDFFQKANEEIVKIAFDENIPRNRFTVITGDITKPNLHMTPDMIEQLQNEVTHIFHLAAIYDLAVPKDIAYNVNVNGTKNVNEWVQTLHNLRRYIYFSTAYVSGTREGRINETELTMNQTFKNHYESTKYEAEVLVREVMDSVPTTI